VNEAWAEVWTETGAGRPLEGGHAIIARRAESDQRVLDILLRFNSPARRPLPKQKRSFEAANASQDS
jgi:hypothetical protein